MLGGLIEIVGLGTGCPSAIDNVTMGMRDHLDVEVDRARAPPSTDRYFVLNQGMVNDSVPGDALHRA